MYKPIWSWSYTPLFITTILINCLVTQKFKSPRNLVEHKLNLVLITRITICAGLSRSLFIGVGGDVWLRGTMVVGLIDWCQQVAGASLARASWPHAFMLSQKFRELLVHCNDLVCWNGMWNAVLVLLLHPPTYLVLKRMRNKIIKLRCKTSSCKKKSL